MHDIFLVHIHLFHHHTFNHGQTLNIFISVILVGLKCGSSISISFINYIGIRRASSLLNYTCANPWCLSAVQGTVHTLRVSEQITESSMQEMHVMLTSQSRMTCEGQHTV